MSKRITIARPYAKAIFQYALEKQQLNAWSAILHNMAAVAQDAQAIAFLTHPLTPKAQRIKLFTSICVQSLAFHGRDFIKILAENHRLFILPNILRLYNGYRAEWEQILDVDIISVAAIPNDYQQKITVVLGKKYQRKIVLHNVIDQSLLGGAILKISDTVIDGSIKGRIARLGQELIE